jgi:hypothetical protein
MAVFCITAVILMFTYNTKIALGKGEVGSSILPSSTIKIKHFIPSL